VDYHFKKHFTVEEANELLPRLVAMLNQIERIEAELQPQADEVSRIHKAAGGTAMAAETTPLNCWTIPPKWAKSWTKSAGWE